MNKNNLNLKSNSYIIILIITLILCFLIQAIALRSVGGKTTKSESNYYSSLARIQCGIKDNPEIMFLGSSITGRLPDRNIGFKGCVNMGCDGSSAVETLIAMDCGLIPTAPKIIIESNTLLMGIDEKESDIFKTLKSPWFIAGQYWSPISSTARPSAFLYSILLGNRIGLTQGPAVTNAELSTAASIPTVYSDKLLSPAQTHFTHRISDIIIRLRKKGIKIWLVALPPKQPIDSVQHKVAVNIAGKATIPFFDLAGGLRPNMITFTDGLHMSPESATLTMRLLTRELNLYNH